MVALLAAVALFSNAEVVATDAQRFTASGDKKLAAGNASGAADDYRAAIAADGNAFEARVNLGAALLKLGDAEGAIESLEAATKARPDNAPALRNLGRAYLKLERWAEGADAMKRSREVDPGNEEALRLQAIATARSGNAGEGIPLLREAAAKSPKNLPLLVELATAETDANDAEAPKTLEKARKAASGTGEEVARAQNDLGLLYRRLGRNKEALEAFRAATKADPSYTQGVTNLGMALYESGDAKTAVGTLATAANKDPDPAIRYVLGQARMAAGDPKGAIEDLEYARSWGHDPKRIAALLSDAHRATGNTKKADEEAAKAGGAFAEAVKEAAKDERAAKAFEAVNKRRYSEAAGLLAKLLESDQTNAKAWLGLGYSKLMLGDAAGAVAGLQKASEGLPNDVDVWYYLGEAYRQSGRLDQATAAWEKVLKLQPARSDVAANLGRMQVQAGNHGAAVTSLRTAAKALPKNLDLQHDLAVALIGAGEHAEGAKVLAGYIAARPDDTPAAEAHAEALAKSGDFPAAVAAYEALAKKQPSVARHAINAGVASRNAKNRAAEKSWLQKAALLAPDDASVAFDLGRLQFEDKEWSQAEASFRRAAKLDPSMADAASNADTAKKNREAIAGNAQRAEEAAAANAKREKDIAAYKAARLHLGVIIAKDKAAADKAAADLKKGKSFADVAKAFSTHDTAKSGGDLGWLEPAALPDWAAPAKTLQPGKTIGPNEIKGLGFVFFTRYGD